MQSPIAGASSSKAGGWKSAIFIIAVETAERFAYYGVAGNLIMYLTKELHQPLAEAAKNVNTWNGVLSIFLLIGAFLTDSFLGRFRATVISTAIFLMGLSLLTVSVAVVPNHLRSAIFFTALYIVAIGDGGHRPSLQTFAADQFDETTLEERKSKSSFFNWWYLGIVLGSFTSVIVVIYVQDNVSWAVGFAIPTAMEAVALAVFFIGYRTYRKQRPVGSPFTKVAQVFVAAAKKWRVEAKLVGQGRICDEVEVKPGLDGGFIRSGLSRTNQFKFLDKATIIDDIDNSSKTRNPWRLCPVTQVEEAKLVLRLLPIWICSLGYAMIVAQVHTFFIKQGSTMDRSFGSIQIPPASLQVFPGFVILVFVPIYDKLIIPFAIKVTGNPYGITPLQRIGAGISLSIVTIVVAAFVEAKRLSVAAEHGLLDKPSVTVPMSVWWLVPQFLVNGLSDVFGYVGLQQLFYDQMPEEMRSMGSALTNASIGFGALASSVVISVVQGASSKWSKEEWLVSNLNRAHLNYFYWVMAVVCMFDLAIYIMLAKWFVMKKVDHGSVV